jgi:hypothetical protein
MERVDWDQIIKKLLHWQWAIAAMFAAVGIGIWLIFHKSLPPLVPLFYSRPWGEEQLVNPLWLWLPLGVALTTTIIITLVVRKLKLDQVLAAMLVAAGTVSETILLLAVLRIILLVT